MGNKPPTPLVQVSGAAVSDRRINHDASDTGLRARRVLKHEIFDINRVLAQLSEETTERTRLIGDKHFNFLVARRSPAVLTGDASNPLVTGGHHAVDRPHTATSQRPQFGGRLQMKQQIIQITAKVAQDHRDGTSVARQDRRPQTRVGRCDTSGVSQALPRKTQRLGGIDDTNCGTWDTRATA